MTRWLANRGEQQPPITSSRMGHLWDALGRGFDALGFDQASGSGWPSPLPSAIAMHRRSLIDSAGWSFLRLTPHGAGKSVVRR